MATQRLADIDDWKALGLSGGRLDEANPVQLNRILDAASSMAAGILKKRHTFPLGAWGDDLKLQVCRLATYLFFQGTGYKVQDGERDTIRDNYKDAIAALKDVANRRADLDGVVDSTPELDEGGAVVASDPLLVESGTVGGGLGAGYDILAGTWVPS